MKVLLKIMIVTLSLSLTTQAANYQEGDFILRVGIAHVSPNDDSSNVLSETDGVGVDSAIGLGFTGTWMLNSQWGFDVLASLPFEHDLKGKGASGDRLSGINIGKTKHLPPTFSFQYYPNVQSNTFTPYVGIGVNYTTFFSEESSGDLRTELGSDDVELKLEDSFGLALQAGADWEINSDLNFNLSIWYMKISTEADVIVDGSTNATIDVDIDPFAVIAGLTWKL